MMNLSFLSIVAICIMSFVALSNGLVQLSVWGGPLRLQATAQHAESPKMFLRRIIHHPIIWLKELEEWKYYSSLDPFHGTDRNSNGTFNPDPLLFPATWLPLRWLQIFALAKAFSTNPLQYRWCSDECGKDIIPRLMKQYLVQLALGDEWHRVFLGEKRIGLGIMVVVSYFIGKVDGILLHILCTSLFSQELHLHSFSMDGSHHL